MLFEENLHHKFIPFLLFTYGVVIRNLLTFFATTLFALNSVRQYLHGSDFHSDERVKIKEEVLTLHLLMTHALPYKHFK